MERTGASPLKPGPGAPAADPTAGPSAGLGPAETPDPGDAEDRDWVRAFQAGKEEGFNRLVLKHKDRIFGLCRRLLGDHDEAEDAAQEVFVRVFHGLGEFRLEAKFSTWLYRIAVNVSKNKMESRAYRDRRSHQPLEAADADGDGAQSSPSPAQELESKGRRQLIEAAIARLDEEQRVLVVLRDVEGRSYEEIAETTGINMGNLKSRLNRGRRQLQEWLKELW